MPNCTLIDHVYLPETEHIIDNLEWSDLDVDESDCVTINEVGRWLEQQGVNVSNFLLLRLVAEESVRKSRALYFTKGALFRD